MVLLALFVTLSSFYFVSCGSNPATSPSTPANTPTPTPNATVFATFTGDEPWQIAIDANGNLYVTLYTPQEVVKITSAGVTSIVASSLYEPYGVAVGPNGNLYVGPYTGTGVTEVSGGSNSTLGSGMSYPDYLVVNSAGTTLYVADYSTGNIWQVGLPGGTTTSLISTGVALTGICMDPSGNIYASTSGNKIIEVTAASITSGTPAVTAFAGNGTASFANGAAASAEFDAPYGLCADSGGNVYVADYTNQAVRKISGGQVSTLIGPSAQSPAFTYTLDDPSGVVLDGHGNLYIDNFSAANIIRYQF
jgi:sugar lactone lactonase YvrE